MEFHNTDNTSQRVKINFARYQHDIDTTQNRAEL